MEGKAWRLNRLHFQLHGDLCFIGVIRSDFQAGGDLLAGARFAKNLQGFLGAGIHTQGARFRREGGMTEFESGNFQYVGSDVPNDESTLCFLAYPNFAKGYGILIHFYFWGSRYRKIYGNFDRLSQGIVRLVGDDGFLGACGQFGGIDGEAKVNAFACLDRTLLRRNGKPSRSGNLDRLEQIQASSRHHLAGKGVDGVNGVDQDFLQFLMTCRRVLGEN